MLKQTLHLAKLAWETKPKKTIQAPPHFQPLKLNQTIKLDASGVVVDQAKPDSVGASFNLETLSLAKAKAKKQLALKATFVARQEVRNSREPNSGLHLEKESEAEAEF